MASIHDVNLFLISAHLDKEWNLRSHDLHQIPKWFKAGSRLFRGISIENSAGMLFPMDISLLTCSPSESSPCLFTGTIMQNSEVFYFTAKIENCKSEFATLKFKQEPR